MANPKGSTLITGLFAENSDADSGTDGVHSVAAVESAGVDNSGVAGRMVSDATNNAVVVAKAVTFFVRTRVCLNLCGAQQSRRGTVFGPAVSVPGKRNSNDMVAESHSPQMMPPGGLSGGPAGNAVLWKAAAAMRVPRPESCVCA
jgi:hypothetical protein